MSFNRPINLSTSLHRSIDQNLPLHHPISVLLSITIYLHVALSTSIYCASFFFDVCQTYVPLGLYVYLPNNPTTSRLYCPYSDLCLYVLLSTSTVHLLATSIYLYVLATSTSDLVRRPAVDLSILLLFQPLRPPIDLPLRPPIELFQPLRLYVLFLSPLSISASTYRPPSTSTSSYRPLTSTSSSYHYFLLLSITSTSSYQKLSTSTSPPRPPVNLYLALYICVLLTYLPLRPPIV